MLQAIFAAATQETTLREMHCTAHHTTMHVSSKQGGRITGESAEREILGLHTTILSHLTTIWLLTASTAQVLECTENWSNIKNKSKTLCYSHQLAQYHTFLMYSETMLTHPSMLTVSSTVNIRKSTFSVHFRTTQTLCHRHRQSQPTGYTLVKSTLFPLHFNEMTLNQCEIDVELTSVPSGKLLTYLEMDV